MEQATVAVNFVTHVSLLLFGVLNIVMHAAVATDQEQRSCAAFMSMPRHLFH